MNDYILISAIPTGGLVLALWWGLGRNARALAAESANRANDRAIAILKKDIADQDRLLADAGDREAILKDANLTLLAENTEFHEAEAKRQKQRVAAARSGAAKRKAAANGKRAGL